MTTNAGKPDPQGAAPGAGGPDIPEARIARMREELRRPLEQIMSYAEALRQGAPAGFGGDLERIRAAAARELDHVEEAVELLRSAAKPAAPAPAAGGDDEVAEEHPTLCDDGGGAKVLVVDADPASRGLLEKLLRWRGFEVDAVGDGPAALARIERQAYSLVVLDLVLPGLRGPEVLVRIRGRHPLAELPIILALPPDASADVVDVLALGANDYVTKPVQLPVLVARMRTQLDLQRALAQVREMAQKLEVRNQVIKQIFGRYVTDQVVESLLRSPEGVALGGESRVVTVLLSDLRGFSSLSERLPPAKVLALLNNYFGVMIPVIQRYGGTIDEIIGDAILVIFGAPTAREGDARRAVTCALDMQRAMARVNARNGAEGLPPLEMGIGLNTGEVIVGNIGSEERTKYGVVGRNVNLAARIEAFTVGGQVLVSEATLLAAGDGVRVDSSFEAFPKGSKEPMRVFELGGIDGPPPIDLPRRSAALVALAEPVSLRFSVLDGIQVTAPDHDGAITHLSAVQARVRSERPVGHLQTVKLEWPGAGPADGRAAYAKVVAAEEGGTRLLLHFTTLAPDADRAIKALVGQR